MSVEDLKKMVEATVRQAMELKDRHTAELNAAVNYACIFSQSQGEYRELVETTGRMGNMIQQTPKGHLFQVSPMETTAGPLQLLKVRRPDPTRPERGDADFTVVDYPAFKKNSLGKKGFKLIKKENFEMIELV